MKQVVLMVMGETNGDRLIPNMSDPIRTMTQRLRDATLPNSSIYARTSPLACMETAGTMHRHLPDHPEPRPLSLLGEETDLDSRMAWKKITQGKGYVRLAAAQHALRAAFEQEVVNKLQEGECYIVILPREAVDHLLKSFGLKLSSALPPLSCVILTVHTNNEEDEVVSKKSKSRSKKSKAKEGEVSYTYTSQEILYIS